MNVTMDEFKKALAELGGTFLDEPWRKEWVSESFAKFVDGKPFSITVGGEQLGRCYHRSVSVTVGGGEADVPKGNGGNYCVIARAEHPVLGPYLKTSCEIDSSD